MKTIDEIMNLVCDRCGVTRRQLTTRGGEVGCRNRKSMFAREVCAIALRRHRNMSYSEIAETLNAKSHSAAASLLKRHSKGALTMAHDIAPWGSSDTGDHGLRIKSLSVGEIIAAIETRQDVAVAVGCYLGEIMRRRYATQTNTVPDVRASNVRELHSLPPVPQQEPRQGAGEAADVQPLR